MCPTSPKSGPEHDVRRVRSMSGPLAGIRVLDLTTVQMGPWCTRILADFGADMIKVEAPEGDSSRYTGVPRHRGMSGSFQHNARGKRSIAMDLKQPAAREALLRLVPTVEAFASNIRPQALARLGLDYQSVKQLNPSIVYLSMVGYGSGGRYAGRPAYDDLIQAASGVPMLLQRSTGRAALHSDGRHRPHRRFGGGQCAARRIAGARAHRHRPADRGADVRDHGAVRAGRTHAGRDLRSAHRPARLCAHAVAASPTRIRPRTASSPCCPTTTASGAASSRRSARRMWWRAIRALPTSPRARRTSMRCTRCSVRSCNIARPTSGSICCSRTTFRASVRIRWRACSTIRHLADSRVLSFRGASVRRPHPHHARAQHLVGNRAADRPLRPSSRPAHARDPRGGRLHAG